MNYRICLKYLGIIYTLIGISMLLPIGFGLYYKETESWSLIISMVIAIVIGLSMAVPFYRVKEDVLRKEGFFIVTLAWVGAGVIGSMPFLISGSLGSPVDAFFEAISGFTTTGSTIIADLTPLSKCILLWRNQTQWLGGMGIIVLMVALFSFFGAGGKSVFYSEAPGVYRTGITPRIQDSARKLWLIYVAISLAETIMLMFGGLSFYEALLHTFSTMATGGFSNHNESIAFYRSAYIDWTIIVFMALAGTNFGLYYVVLTMGGKLKTFIQDYEWKVYVGILLTSTILITIFLSFNNVYSFSEGLRHSAFQVVSMATTTGYCTQDFDRWPQFARLLLVVLMFVGGCTGSTGGGMKVFRVIVVIKHAFQEIFRMFHPSAISTLRVGRQVVINETKSNILGFFVLSMMLFAGFSLFVAAYDIDLITSTTSVAATLWNIGPGLSRVGAVQNFAWMPAGVKAGLSLAMIIGRLELFTVLVLFTPKFWKS